MSGQVSDVQGPKMTGFERGLASIAAPTSLPKSDTLMRAGAGMRWPPAPRGRDRSPPAPPLTGRCSVPARQGGGHLTPCQGTPGTEN